MFADKKKVAMIIAAVLVSAAALWFVLRTHAASSHADNTDTGTGDAGAWPSVMFTSGGAGASSTPVSGDSTTLPVAAPATNDTAIAAALTGAQSAINSNTQLGLNANATDLFAGLPASLSKAGLLALNATQSQDASGATTLNATAVYRPAADVPVPVNHFFWDGNDYGSSANFISQNLANYQNITGRGADDTILNQLKSYVAIAKTDPRNQVPA